jgi:HK97 gp10 family phage protein
MSKTFTIKSTAIDKFLKNVKNEQKKIEKDLTSKVTDITRVVWNIAKKKRAVIESPRKNRSGKYVVSNPDAAIGVPVDTGALQSSIKMDIKWHGDKIVGRVFIDPGSEAAKYAKMIEFGTSKMAPRSFLRSSMNENRAWIRDRFKRKIV